MHIRKNIKGLKKDENSEKMEVEKKLVSLHRKKRRNMYKHGRYS